MSDHSATLIERLLMAVSVGAFVGALELLVNFSWKYLKAGMVVGAVFTGVLFVLLPLLSERRCERRWGLASGSAVAGMIAGAAWWHAAKASVSAWVSVGIGVVLAMLMVL